MTATELIESLKAKGGVLILEGEQIKFQLPQDATHLVEQLRERKQELSPILRSCGGRIATFPHCPRCASYALYRKDDLGNYECLTCELQDIPEVTARRAN